MAGAPRSSKKVAIARPALRQQPPAWYRPDADDDRYASQRDDSYPRDYEDEDFASHDFDSQDNRPLAGPPLLSLPSMPAIPAARPKSSRRDDSGRHRTLLDSTARQSAVRQDDSPDVSYPDDGQTVRSRGVRRRENSSARPLSSLSGLRAQSVPEEPEEMEDYDDDRALVPVAPPLPDLVPNLAAFRPRAAARLRVDTRALMLHARSPWSLTRLVLAVAALTVALFATLAAVGEPSQPLMSAFETSSGSHAAIAVAAMVRPETQIERPDLYDSYQQFLDWKGAACSAAALSETLTAWGVQHATIGKMIDDMNSGAQPYISPYAGLLQTGGFQFAAAQVGYRADIGTNFSLSYKQLLYITNNLGIPVIVNVRISWGYFSFFAGGHFLVVTGGDSQGVNIVDSSTYYIHYLQKNVLYSMFTGITTIIVPKDFHYSIPPM